MLFAYGRLDAAGAQHGGHRIAEIALVHGRRRLDRHQRHDLQQVALDHVPQGAGAVVVAGAALQGEILVEDDLHLFDVLPVPDRLQEVVREAQAQDVQDRGLAQEMVHPVDVVLRDQRGQRLVEVAGRIPRSEPNGFSITSRVPAGTCSGLSASQASWLIRGGRAK